jgi:hypothetical protein
MAKFCLSISYRSPRPKASDVFQNSEELVHKMSWLNVPVRVQIRRLTERFSRNEALLRYRRRITTFNGTLHWFLQWTSCALCTFSHLISLISFLHLLYVISTLCYCYRYVVELLSCIRILYHIIRSSLCVCAFISCSPLLSFLLSFAREWLYWHCRILNQLCVGDLKDPLLVLVLH